MSRPLNIIRQYLDYDAFSLYLKIALPVFKGLLENEVIVLSR